MDGRRFSVVRSCCLAVVSRQEEEEEEEEEEELSAVRLSGIHHLGVTAC
jgi:hypothetical protein